MEKICMLIVVCLLGCENNKPYDIPEMSEAVLADRAIRVCEGANEKKGRVLLEFSAPWCGDCQKLHTLKTTEPLQKELGLWDALVINVGRFDKHEDLLRSFKVNAIANWILLDPPTDCTTELSQWTVVYQRTLEPASGKSVTAQDLANWLEKYRRDGPT